MKRAKSSDLSPVALLVLRNLGVGVCRRIAHDHRDFVEPFSPRGAKSLGTEVDSVAPSCISRMHDDRLQDAVLADVCSEFFERVFGELGAWVVRVLVEQ